MPTWVEAGQKSEFFYKRADLSVIPNVTVKTLPLYAIHTIFAFLQLSLKQFFD